MQRWKAQVRKLKTLTFTLYLAYKHPRTPWYARVFVAGVVAYAFSPIDLIPDFIPVIGMFDDLILVPIGIFIAIRLIPKDVFAECRLEAEAMTRGEKPVNRTAALVIVTIWLALGMLGLLLLIRALLPGKG